MTGPTPGTEARILLLPPHGRTAHLSSISPSRTASSFFRALLSRAMLFFRRPLVRRRSRWLSAAIISTIWRRRATRSASKLRGFVRQTRGPAAWSPRRNARSPRHRSGRSWRVAERLAKARTWAGLTTTTGRPAPARPAATTVSNPPVASTATARARAVFSRSINSSKPAPLRLTQSSRRRAVHAHPDDLSKRRCRHKSRPSDPILAQAGFAERPKRLFGFDGTASEDPALPRAWCP